MNNIKRISVFGGASPRPGEMAYVEAERLGYLLGKAGCTVLNGGYVGTMEAVSKGAFRAGGHVIGVTCAEIEKWRKVGANPYIHQERRCETLSERLDVLIKECDAAIALMGGIGSLAEILYLWNHMVIQAVPSKPLILVGERWKTIFNVINEKFVGYSSPSQLALLQMVPDVDAAAKLVIDS